MNLSNFEHRAQQRHTVVNQKRTSLVTFRNMTLLRGCLFDRSCLSILSLVFSRFASSVWGEDICITRQGTLSIDSLRMNADVIYPVLVVSTAMHRRDIQCISNVEESFIGHSKDKWCCLIISFSRYGMTGERSRKRGPYG